MQCSAITIYTICLLFPISLSFQRGRPPKSAIALSAPMILEEDGEPMTMENAIEELFGAVMTAMDPDGRLYSYDFRLLPSREVRFTSIAFY